MRETEVGSGSKHRVVWTLFVMIFFILILFALYMRSPFAQVKVVTVTGERSVAAADLLRDSGITVGENILQIPMASAQARLLEDFPILSSVAIDRSFTHQSVVIIVREHTLAGILAADGSLYRVLQDGIVLDKDPTGVGVQDPILTASFPLAVSLGQRLTNPALLSVCAQLPSLPFADIQQLSELHVMSGPTGPVILAFTRDGFEIRMPVAHMKASLHLYDEVHAKLLASHVAPGLVDLMSGEQAVYKPYQKG